MNPFIKLKDIEKNYGSTPVLRGVNLEIEAGECLAIKGASGSGKSTLLYLLGGLEKASKGEVHVAQKNLNKLDDDSLAQFRNQTVGFVFQFHFLLPSITAWGNIILPARIGGHDVNKVTVRAKNLAQRLGVAGLLEKWPHQLSGGEQQRINIIRALSLQPPLLLCDEPTGNLDSLNSQKVTTLLKELAVENKSTLILVTHDEKVASVFERKIVIEDGQIIR
ncbi:MAG: ABC transporter ATP-binding protein [Bacteriovoracaceae bacterium]|nr:ABC transporter ATP-binding protein [Bacteriovoracaceae bacterium]